MARDVGTEGEHVFSAWCSHAGLTSNKSHTDRYGWDHLVEFPLELVDGKPVDQHPSPITCKVQVKSTLGSPGKVQVKLSAMYHLAVAQLPAFFVFFEFGESSTPVAAYLVHVDDDLIAKTLKRVRKKEHEGKRHKLHEAKITVSYTDTHKIQNTSGSGLRDAIRAYVPKGMNIYIEQKNLWLAELGFERSRYKATMTFEAEPETNVLMSLVDMSIGVRTEPLKVSGFEASSLRFGIELPESSLSGMSEGMVTLTGSNKSDGILFFKESLYSVPIEFPAVFHLPSLGCKLPDKYLKCRIDAGIIEFIQCAGSVDFTIKSFFDGHVALDEMEKRVSLLKILVSGKPFRYGYIFEGKKLEIDVGPLEITLPDPAEIEGLVHKAISICREFNVSAGTVISDLNILLYFKEYIDGFYAILKCDPGLVSIGIAEVVVHENSFDDEFPPFVMVQGLKTRIGNICFGMVFSIRSTNPPVFSDDGSASISATEIRIEEKFVGSPAEIDALLLEPKVHALSRVLEQEGFQVLANNSEDCAA